MYRYCWWFVWALLIFLGTLWCVHEHFSVRFLYSKIQFFSNVQNNGQIFFFWKSNNGFPLMALNLTYMWIIVAKLAKLQKSIFSRGTPTATTTTTIIYHYSLIQYIAIYCNSIVATSPPHTYCNTFLVPPINTILLQYLLQYIAIQYIVPYLWSWGFYRNVGSIILAIFQKKVEHFAWWNFSM